MNGDERSRALAVEFGDERGRERMVLGADVRGPVFHPHQIARRFLAAIFTAAITSG